MNSMGRAWGVYWTRHNEPADGNGGEISRAQIASNGAYWAPSSRWYDDELPGLLHSPPQGDQFNAFDLYAVGLMGYEEAVI